jgi:broad specificity phosphatase PhoE
MLPSWGLATVYFIRHGQAGNRQDYDRLSDVGREQSTLLGNWLSKSHLRFDNAYSGRLNRQRETAEYVRQTCLQGGTPFPVVTDDPRFDEFDLDAVYRGIAPQIAAHDAEFRLQFEELGRQALDADSTVHRTWAQCEITALRGWIDGAYEFEGESFQGFVKRVGSGAGLLEGPGNIAVFTSATPIAVWVGNALELEGRKLMQLAGVLYNASMTVVKVDSERVRLFQFNTVPHLERPELLTHR